MINFNTFFKNLFDTSRISDAALKLYAQDHIARLTSGDTAGIYTELRDATFSAYNGYYGEMTEEDIAYVTRLTKTMNMKKVFEEFKDQAGKQEGIVHTRLGRDSAEYKAFYPLGITEYNHATLANVENLMDRMINACDKYSANVGPELKVLFTDIRDRFVSARNEQLLIKGEVKTKKEETSLSRDVLEKQLMKNLLLIAADHIGNPAGGMVYFDQSIIRADKHDNEPEPNPVP